MFEMPPYWNCPACHEKNVFGVLTVGDGSYTRRCKKCQHKDRFYLPEVDKKVIYIDQFAISNVFVHRADPDKQSPHKDFWIDLENQIQKLVLLQAAIFPDSNIHLDESIVSHNFEGLRNTYRSISGDTSLYNISDVEKLQITDFAESWISDSNIPTIEFSVDKILDGKRNQWLPTLRIEVNTDFSQFAAEIRSSRQSASTEFAELFGRWGAEKPSFEEILENEG